MWLKNRKGLRHRLPSKVQAWVYETGSLTQRLRADYGASVKVKILYHRWARPSLDECKLLAVPTHHYALTREVLLHADGKPLLLARTIIPEATLKGAHRNLSHLGTRPLGEVIFAYPKLGRLALEATLLPTVCWSPAALELADIQQSIWGRRTVYAIAGCSMLVSEFFLPEIL